MKKLDIGCGKNKQSGYIGVDKEPYEGVDVILDLDKDRLPFEDNSVDEVYTSHTLEHLNNPLFCIKEIHRVLKNDGLLIVRVPHYSCPRAQNILHTKFYSSIMFDIFSPDPSPFKSRIEGIRFKIVSKRVYVYRSFFLPHTFLIEKFAIFFPYFYERFLIGFAAAYDIKFVLKAMK